MGKRIVIALGGNALGKNLEEQMHAVKTTASAIADLIEDGHEVVIAHGNGPQVGMIQNAFAAYHKQQAKSDIMPLSMCVAMSQGYIGYDLQNMIGEELDRRGLGIHCATVLTQVAVDPADPAFQHPTKPIGAFMTEEEAKKLAAEKGIDVAEDAGRGWRQVVASPRPKEIVEIATVKALMNAKHAVIAAGGGGIPVVWEDKYHLKGVPAVIDKDFASECMAEQLDADMLIILTAVEKVAINFGKPDQKNLDELTPDEARKYMAEGQFAPGSMLPKVEAAVKFAESKPGRTSLITLLEKAKDGKLSGTPAVIDKDFGSELLAELLDADMLIILTAVEKVAINFNKPDQKGLDDLTPAEARKYMEENQFAKGSMLPKVQAAVKFAESKPGRTALITLLEKAKDGIEGKTGTRVHQ